MRKTLQLYTIPPSFPFLDYLARGVADLYAKKSDPLALSRVTILLPTRRAVRNLSDAFLRLIRERGPNALLLPKLRPIGDVDEDELLIEGLSVEPDTDAFGDLVPSMPALRRQFILAQLIHRWSERKGQGDRNLNLAHAPQLIRLAAELGRFLDSLITERIDFSNLDKIVPDQFTEHWQDVLGFLNIISEHWSSILDEEGLIDPAERRNRLLEAQAERWRNAPPSDPVIAAGSTGSIPATADLLSVIARLNCGAVVLPGLDLEMGDGAWATVDPGHPQFGMKELLSHMRVERGDVKLWPSVEDIEEPKAVRLRRRVIAEALRPATSTDGWQSAIGQFQSEGWDRGLQGLSYITMEDPGEEAATIAVILREVLETRGATGVLVTPDRDLARRVAAKLRRWGVAIDDSAGTPLGQTPVGTFLRLIAEVARDEAAPVPLLSLLKHHMCRCGYDAHEQRRLVERLELACLRGVRPGNGVAGLARACERLDVDIRGLPEFLRLLESALGPLLEVSRGKASPFRDFLVAHIEAAESLALTSGGTCSDLWSGDDGEAAARFMAEMLDDAAYAPAFAWTEYASLIEGLMSERVVRPKTGRHPRLFIWGPLEARLQSADLIILGGLNEGTWPVRVDADPWLSRQMRAQLGLSPLERRIGLAAHDFAQLTNAERVVLTRSERVDGTPTVASRWLMRLETILRGAGVHGMLQSDKPYAVWARRLDQADGYAPLSPPAPCPSVAVRPRRFSVTEIETWIRDPYSIYAKKILGLSPLEPLDHDPGPLERGTLIHTILEKFVSRFPDRLPDKAYDELVAIAQDVFDRFALAPALRTFWWHQFLHIARGFIEFETDLRERGRPLGTELSGALALPAPAGSVTLSARADRIDEVEGGFAIYDYKIGAVPSRTQVEAQLFPQLPLLGLIAREGKFKGLDPLRVTCLSYLQLSVSGSTRPKRSIADDEEDAAELIAETEAGLVRYIAEFDDETTPYLSRPRPIFVAREGVYDHLARVKEWSVPGLADVEDGS